MCLRGSGKKIEVGCILVWPLGQLGLRRIRVFVPDSYLFFQDRDGLESAPGT